MTFISKNIDELELRLPSPLGPLMAKLQRKGVINASEREKLNSKSEGPERNYHLLSMIDKKGPKAEQVFCEVLRSVDPFLVESLEGAKEEERKMESEEVKQKNERKHVSEKHFIDRHRAALINGVKMVDGVMDLLMERDALDKEAYGKVRSCKTSQEQMRSLIDHCTTQEEKNLLYEAVKKTHQFLIKELEEH